MPVSRISTEPPPPPLVGEFMATWEDTVVFGRGGSTKGTTAAWLALQAVRNDPETVAYIIDFEHHEDEWGGRLARFGTTPDETERIFYASPFSGAWTYPRGSLPEVAEYVRQDCERLGVTLLIVDSMSAAMGKGEAMGGWSDAGDYFDALRHIRGDRQMRSLNLAHVTGNAEKFPDRPFGSSQIHNAARETWAIAVNEERLDGPEAHGLTYADVELRCKKASGRRKPAPQLLTYTYEPDYGAITATLKLGNLSNGDMIYQVLRDLTGNPLVDAAKIARAVNLEFATTLTPAQVYDAIRRDTRSKTPRFEVTGARFPPGSDWSDKDGSVWFG